MSEATSGNKFDAGPGYREACHRARIRATRWLIRATPTAVIASASEAIHDATKEERMDCFVASLLAMTKTS